MNQQKPKQARAVKWLHIVLTAVAIGFMFALIGTHWGDLVRANFDPDWHLVMLATLAAVGLFILDAAGWHLILRSQRCDIAFAQSLRIWMVSSVTRYLPGAIWPYASRASLAKAEGIGVATSSVSMYTETLLLATSSLAVGLPALLSLTTDTAQLQIAVTVAALGAICLHPRAMTLWHRLPGPLGRFFSSAALPPARSTALLYLYYLGFWALFSAVFLIAASAVTSIAPDSRMAVATALPLGFMIGFVVVFVPGGIGVRESAIYGLLLPHLTSGHALAIAIGSRIWLTLAEILALVFALLLSSAASRFVRNT